MYELKEEAGEMRHKALAPLNFLSSDLPTAHTFRDGVLLCGALIFKALEFENYLSKLSNRKKVLEEAI